MKPEINSAHVRRAALLVAALNLGYFFIEFAMARKIGSVALFADSADFAEDFSIGLLISLALGWSARARARLGMGLAAILLMPGLAAAWTAWMKFHLPVAPAAAVLTLTGAGAMAVNSGCALMLARVQLHGGSLTRAAFLSARNDVAASMAVMAAGVVTGFWWRSAWPDVVVGLGIAALNVGAAREVWGAARAEG